MRVAVFVAAPLALLAACSPAAEQAPRLAIEMSADSRATMEGVNAARFTTQMAPTLEESTLAAPQPPAGAAPPMAAPDASASYDAGLVRIQVLLDRAHFSPGVIDGHDGENVRKAVSAYQAAHNLPVNGLADDAFLRRLEQADASPALVPYVLSYADVSGPFVNVPSDLEAMSRLDHVGYESAAEAVAEKFHMDEDLLRGLNPGVDFMRHGAEIVVANAGGGLHAAVASIEIDTEEGAVRAFDAAHNLLAYYPASVGSAGAPAPVGAHTVLGVAFDPTYRYDPARLPTFGARDHGVVDIAAGPNNPVGAVWIALSADTYGIHGAPNPALVSKTQSHGCIRLTNWDAIELGRAIRAGVPVRIGAAPGPAARGGERG